jgi:hypothetical protein
MKKVLCTLAASALFLLTTGTGSITLANGKVKSATSKACPTPPKRHHKVHCPTPCEEPVTCETVACEPVCNPCPPQPCYMFQTGPYVGALIGYNHMWGKSKAKMFDFFLADAKKTSNSFIGELELGWRYVFPMGFTTGFEVAADFSNDHVKSNLTLLPPPFTNISTLGHKFKRNFSLVPSFTVGMIFCSNWHAFAKFGLGVSWFKDHLTTADGRTFKTNKRKAGFVPELGLEYGYNCNLSIIGTVGYEIYEQAQSKYAAPILSRTGIRQNHVEMTVAPRFFNAKIGLLYRM